jgi:hypothetical protein
MRCRLMVLIVGCWAVAGYGEQGPSATSKPLHYLHRYIFPELVQKMLQWPDQGTWEGDKRVRRDLALGHLGRDESIRWINTIISPDWLPPDPNALRSDMIMIRDEYVPPSSTSNPPPLSATHVRWSANGYDIRVTQTRGIMVIKLTPQTGQAEQAKTPDALKVYAKEMARRLFKDSYTLLLGAEGTREITHLRDAIIDYSFDCALISEMHGGLAAAQWSSSLVDLERSKK